MTVYQVIYADPPWAYRGKQMNFQSYGRGKVYENHVHDHYPTLSTEQLKAAPVGQLAAPDSLLYLWVTSPNLVAGIAVGEAWGFEYRTVAFVWEKQRTNYGFYTLSSCELCLVFKRGRIPRRSATPRQFQRSAGDTLESQLRYAVVLN